MNTDTHEFWQEVYPLDDHRELKPPQSTTWSGPETDFRTRTRILEGPWAFVSVTAIPGAAESGRA